MPRAQLFFEVEPFAHEFDQYFFYAPDTHTDPYGFANNQRLSHLRSKGEQKYRAKYFAWLSYHHPQIADEYCKEIDISITPYKGHPIPNDKWSDGAKEAFIKQSKFNKKIAIICIAILLLIGVISAGVSLMNILYDKYGTAVQKKPEAVIEDSNPALSNDIETSQSKSSEQSKLDENKDEPQNASNNEKNISDVHSKEQSNLTRAVNPVWDEITQFAWSTKVLAYIYPYLNRSNKVDLRNAAKKGNINAQTLAAIGMHTGRLGNVDHKGELDDFLLPACSNGHGRACALVAVHYSKGFGVPKNEQTALSYYKRSCTLGALYGCYYEAERYFTGFGVQQNIPRAIKTYKETCELGVGRSCWRMAYAHVLGFGADKDIDLARRYYDRSRLLEKPLKTPFFEDAFESSIKG